MQYAANRLIYAKCQRRVQTDRFLKTDISLEEIYAENERAG
jgi:hypothetical protein